MQDPRIHEHGGCSGGCRARSWFSWWAVQSGVDAVEVDEEVTGATQGRTRAVGRRVDDESGVLQPVRQLGEGDLRLGTGQGGSEAVVDAAAEAEVLVVLAVGVEAVGVRNEVGVAAAGGEHEYDR